MTGILKSFETVLLDQPFEFIIKRLTTAPQVQYDTLDITI